MPDETLRGLREELASITIMASKDWSRIRVWAAKASAYIGQKYPDRLDDFDIHTDDPTFQIVVLILEGSRQTQRLVGRSKR